MPAAYLNHPCPQCGAKLFDETQSPYFKAGRPVAKCSNKATCTYVEWPPKNGAAPVAHAAPAPAPARQAVSNPPYVPAIDGPAQTGDPILSNYLRALDDVAKPVADVLRLHNVPVTAEAIVAAAATVHISRSRG